jgi:hypothetical protein
MGQCSAMTPERAVSFLAVSNEEPNAYFAERGYQLVVVERDLDSELPRGALSRGSTHWADLVRIETGEVVVRSYGSGRD